MTKKYYVTMTDKFMSGWGTADHRINKLVLECDSYEEAVRVSEHAETRQGMKYINIRSSWPYFYPAYRYFVSHHNKTDYPHWYE